MFNNLEGSHHFKKEIDKWVLEGIITSDQREQLIQKYQLNKERAWYLESTFIVSALGISLVGMGIFLLISHNWNNLGVGLRSFICLLPLILSYVGGILSLYQKKLERASLIFFLSSILLGANIFMQAQILHISSYYPNGILLWMIGILPFGLIWRGDLFWSLIHFLFGIWIVMLFEGADFNLLIPIWILLFCVQQFRKPSVWVHLLGVVNFSLVVIFIEYCLFKDIYREAYFFYNFMFYILSMLFFSATTSGLLKFKDSILSRYEHVINSFLILCIYIFSFGYSSNLADKKYSAEFPIVIGIVFILSFIPALNYIFKKRPINSFENIKFIILISNFLFLHLSNIWFAWGADVLFKFWASFVLFIILVLMIKSGLEKKKKTEFMSGVTGIIILAFTRYLDLFTDFTISAIIFIFCGIFLTWINRYWNKHYLAQNEKSIISPGSDEEK